MGTPFLLKSKLWIFPLLLAVLANFNVLYNQFVWDDIILIKNQVPGFTTLHSVFFPDPNIFQFSKDYYRPLIILSLLWDHYFWNENPLGYHLTAYLVHLANTLLVFFLSATLLKEYSNKYWVAFIASSLFAVHPIHTENVAWIAGRSDSIPAFFIFAAMLFYAKYRSKEKPAYHLLVLSNLSFFIALLGKEVSLFFLFLLPLYDHLEKRRALASHQKPPAIHLGSYLFPFFSFLIYFFLRRMALGSPLGTTRWVTRPDENILQEIILVLGYYLKKLLWPFQLQAFIPDIPSTLFHFLLSIFLLSASGLLFFWAYRKNRSMVAFATAWIFIALGPSLLVAFSTVSKTPLAERYLYIPSFGFCLLLGILFTQGFNTPWFKERIPRAFQTLLMILTLSVFLIPWTWTTLHRNLVWNNNINFWTDLTQKAPDYGLPHNNLGQAYLEERKLGKAELEFKLAIQLKYEDFGKSLAYSALGNIYRHKKSYNESEKALLNALKFFESNHRAYFYLGALYFDQADEEEPKSSQERQLLKKARNHVEQALIINPFLVRGYYEMGLIQRRLGEQQKARRNFQRVLELSTDPSSIYVQRSKNLLAQTPDALPKH